MPGYNTSQELAHLLDVGPRFSPDLVVVGFFENDIVENFPVASPGRFARARSAALSWLYRHVYSIELYKSAVSADRLEVVRREQLSSAAGAHRVGGAADRQPGADTRPGGAALTSFDRLPRRRPSRPPAVRRRRGSIPICCRSSSASGDGPIGSTAIRRFQQLGREGASPVVFFANLVPLTCRDEDVFYDGGSAALNRFYMQILGEAPRRSASTTRSGTCGRRRCPLRPATRWGIRTRSRPRCCSSICATSGAGGAGTWTGPRPHSGRFHPGDER